MLGVEITLKKIKSLKKNVQCYITLGVGYILYSPNVFTKLDWGREVRTGFVYWLCHLLCDLGQVSYPFLSLVSSF